MNQEVKRLWLEALRSGVFPQGTGALQNSGQFCCLGVLCELAVKNRIIPPPNVEGYYDGELTYLPTSVKNWAGLSTDNPSVYVAKELWERMNFDAAKVCSETNLSLAEINDLDVPFTEIAQLIEDQL